MATLAKRINCMKCKHFYVTWDQTHPIGCKVFGFKGKELPSVAVRRATGKDCPSFEAKS